MNDSDGRRRRPAARKGLSKKARFEVFKRDKFACQYCGLKAPEIVLQVDHIRPVSRGGENDLLNLITSCAACNGGKGARPLDDQSVLEKQRRQLEELQAKREQIEMMVEWQRGLTALADHALDQVCEYFKGLVPGHSLNEHGRAQLRQILHAHPLETVLEELRKATAKCLRIESGTATQESVGIAWTVFSNACKWREQRQRDPVGSELRYIRGMMRNRYVYYCPLDLALAVLMEAHAAGVSTETMKQIVYRNRNWTQWSEDMREEIEAARAVAKGEP